MPNIDPGDVTKAELAAGTELGEEVTPALLKEIIIADGNIGVISGLSDITYASDGVYSNPGLVVTYNNYDLNDLADTSMGIAVESYPYTVDLLNEGNNYVDIYMSVSDFADPVVYHVSSDSDCDDMAATCAASGCEVVVYTTAFSELEIAGLKDSFGWEAAGTAAASYNNLVSSLTLEVSRTFQNKSFVFNYQKAGTFSRDNYTIMSPSPLPVYSSTGSASEVEDLLGQTSTVPNTTTTTTTTTATMGY